jgi:hypothetical protein
MSTMPPIDPDLRVLLAKSEPRDQPETLVDHTWEVLSRLADQLRLRPTLAEAPVALAVLGNILA